MFCMARTEATGKFEFTDHTACRTWFRKDSVPVRSLRIKNVTVRQAFNGPGPNMLLRIVGQYTVSGACSWMPFSRTSCITPITSRHGIDGYSRKRLPIAAEGEPHSSRARFSETIATDLRP